MAMVVIKSRGRISRTIGAQVGTYAEVRRRNMATGMINELFKTVAR